LGEKTICLAIYEYYILPNLSTTLIFQKITRVEGGEAGVGQSDSRSGQKNPIGAFVGLDMFDGDPRIGGLLNGSYFVYNAKSGVHHFSMPGDRARNDR
jgi:hypothetical protein